MRHNKKFNHLGRKTAHRKAMLANMAASLIEHKRISTTVAKAKALKIYVEPLITRSKEDTTNSRRRVFSHLQNKDAVSELFREIAGKIGDRPGGYTRILKTGNRFGDNAEMCMIELVDYNENMLSAGKEAAKEKATTRRSRRVKKTSVDAPKAEVTKKVNKVSNKIVDTTIEDSSEIVDVENAVDVVEDNVPEVAVDAVEDVIEELDETVPEESVEAVDAQAEEPKAEESGENVEGDKKE